MHKLYEDIKRELREIDENGININNLDAVFKLADIAKDLCEIIKCEEGEMNMRERHDGYGSYMDGGYGMRDTYRPSGYGTQYNPGHMGNRYNGMDPRISDHINRIMEDTDMYQYGRQRYRESGSRDKLHEGIEKLMYSICTFIKGIEEFAETPEEKEIVRKHIQNLRVG